MPDKYSLDDILNEFSGGETKKPKRDLSKSFDLDELLSGTAASKKTQTPAPKPTISETKAAPATEIKPLPPAQKPTIPEKKSAPATEIKTLPPALKPTIPENNSAPAKEIKPLPPALKPVIPETRKAADPKTLKTPLNLTGVEDKTAPLNTVKPARQEKTASEISSASEKSVTQQPIINAASEKTVRIDTSVQERQGQDQPSSAEPARRFRHEHDNQKTAPKPETPQTKQTGKASEKTGAFGGKFTKNTSGDSEAEKEKALNERRKRKISEFILDSEEEVQPPGAEKHTEYSSFEDATKISAELAELRATMVIRMLVLVIFALISAYTTAAKDYSLPLMSFLNPETQQNSFAFVQMALCLLSGLVCYSTIVSGVKKLIAFRADYDSLCAVVTIFALTGSLLLSSRNYTLQGGTSHIFVNVAIASLLFNNVGKLLIANRVKRNFGYITDDAERYAIINVENEERAEQLTKGALTDVPVLSTMRKTGFSENFLRYSYSSDICDRFCRYAVPGAIILSVIIAVLSAVMHSYTFGDEMFYVAFSVFTLSLSICSCLAMPLVVNLPLADASKHFVESSGAVLGYQSVDDFSDTNSIMLDATKLFPSGSVRMTTLRPITDTKINDAIIEAASLTMHANSILKHFFYNMIDGRTEVINNVESYIYEDSMGLSSWINNRRVLLGNRELMMNHSIEGLPSMSAEKEACGKNGSAVYVSVSGNVMAMFVLELTASPEIKRWLHRLCRNDICVVMRCVDSLLTVSRISEIFDIPEEMIKIIPFRMHDQFAEETTYVSKQSASMICSGRLSSMASLILGAKRLKKTAVAGLILQSSAMLLGVVLCLIMTISGNFIRFNASLVLIYNLIWTIVTLITVSMKTRS